MVSVTNTVESRTRVLCSISRLPLVPEATVTVFLLGYLGKTKKMKYCQVENEIFILIKVSINCKPIIKCPLIFFFYKSGKDSLPKAFFVVVKMSSSPYSDYKKKGYLNKL